MAPRPTEIRHAVPIWHCSWWGLPCRPCYQRRGGLLNHRFTLTLHARRSVFCGAIRQIALPRRYLAPFHHGVRTFLDAHPQKDATARSSDPPHIGSRLPLCLSQVNDKLRALNRVARSSIIAQSVASSGPTCHGRNLWRNASKTASTPASFTG